MCKISKKSPSIDTIDAATEVAYFRASLKGASAKEKAEVAAWIRALRPEDRDLIPGHYQG